MDAIASIDGWRAAGAAGLALLAMTSLLIGAAVGLFLRPSPKVTAIVMAFGTGALIQALAVELAFEGAERLRREAGLDGVASWLWVAAGFVAGGLVYYVGTRIIDQRGGALRNRPSTRRFLLEKKREESEGLLSQLARVDVVRSLPPEDVEALLACVDPVAARAGETIFHAGDRGDALYLIREGAVEIISGGGPPRPDAASAVAVAVAPIARLGPGQSFGEMALLTGEPRSATAVAVEDTRLLRLAKEQFDELMRRSHHLRRAVSALSSRRLLENVRGAAGEREADHWKKVALASIESLSRSEEATLIEKHAGSSAPYAIFLGALLDGIPESTVIGSSFVSLAHVELTLIAAVFLANLPEAMASAAGMRDAGLGAGRIFRLWLGLIAAGALAAAAGNALLASTPPATFTFVEAVAGGGILAMISSVMMPEAYEHGGAEVGLATIGGFLTAFLFAVM